MNFLAHLYLSQNHTDVLIGNFIADQIKGNQYTQFSDSIQFGIIMHRAIDTYTDNHPIFKESKQRLNGKYRHYKGVIIDMIYDHFLAKNWHQYSAIPLKNFSESVYKLLMNRFDGLPEKTQYLLPYMVKQNWLYSYRTIEGIDHILTQMNKRTKGLSKMDEAVLDLQANYVNFEQDFSVFFEDIQNYTQNYLSRI